MVAGTIVRFDRTRGYGFIAPDLGGDDVFVHANDLDVDDDAVTVGRRAEFQVVDGERGPKAYGVRVLETTAAAGEAAGPPREANGTAPAPAAALDVDECEVLSEQEFSSEVTELLLRATPTLTGAQIVAVRKSLGDLARSHRWID